MKILDQYPLYVLLKIWNNYTDTSIKYYDAHYGYRTGHKSLVTQKLSLIVLTQCILYHIPQNRLSLLN